MQPPQHIVETTDNPLSLKLEMELEAKAVILIQAILENRG